MFCVCLFSENRPQGVDDLPVMQTEQVNMPPTIPTPVCADHTGKGVPYSTTSTLKKARYRMRKCFLKAGKRMSSLKKIGLTGPKTTRATMVPESKKIKENLNKQLKNLQQKRDKKSIDHCEVVATAGNPRLAAGTSAAQSLQKDQTESSYLSSWRISH